MILKNLLILQNRKLVKKDIEFDAFIKKISNNLKDGEDCDGYFLMPGLRDAHVHLASRLVSGAGIGLTKYEYFNEIGFNVHKKRRDIDIYNSSLLACIELLKQGVTSVDTMDMKPETVIKAIKKAGLDYTACFPLKDFGEEGFNLKKQFDYAVNFNMIGIANEYESTPQLIREGLCIAKENDLPIHMHACETKEEVNHFKHLTGMKTIPYLEKIGFLDYDVRLAHCTFTDSKDILILAEHNVPVLHCPTSNSLISRNVPNIRLMLENNIPIRIGTDSFIWNQNPSVLHEALVSHQLTGISLMKSYLMTHNPLYIGSPANFSLVNLEKLKPFNFLEDFLIKLMNIDSVERVFIKGSEINFNKFNEDYLKKEVNKARKRIFK